MWNINFFISSCTLVTAVIHYRNSCLYRQIEKLTDQRIQQSVASGKQMEVVRRNGEKKVSQMKQELEKEQTKSKVKEEEVDKLKR